MSSNNLFSFHRLWKAGLGSVGSNGVCFQEEEGERKRRQEQDQQRVVSQMVELQSAKTQLEQEVDAHKRRLRLHTEAQAARQVMPEIFLFHPI